MTSTGMGKYRRFVAGATGMVAGAVLAFAAQAQTPTPTLTDTQAEGLIQRGKMLATAADCMACHTAPKGGKSFAGGYGIESPLGTIYSTNITPSKTAGIGDYSEEDFVRAVQRGIRKDGSHLYPAMPYSAYAEITPEDMKALYAYFSQGVAAVDTPAPHHTDLPFPFNVRFSMAFWNLLYANKQSFQPDASKTDEINRGAYLAGALGHCSSCHTPRNVLMGEDLSQYLSGGHVGAWYAPNITSDAVSGIGGWSTDELVQYFRTGHAPGKGQAGGGMAEAVQNSLQHLPDSDLRALAAYLKTVPPIRQAGETRPAYSYGAADSAESGIRGRYAENEHDSLRSGAELYSGMCASCHQATGSGSGNQAYPSLFHNTATGAANASNLLATIVYGIDREANGQHVLMPAFGTGSYVDTLSDQQIADIANYVLTSYGNPSVKVSAQDVATTRTGGPVPLLAKIQPMILPAISVLVLVALALITWVVIRRRRRQQSA